MKQEEITRALWPKQNDWYFSRLLKIGQESMLFPFRFATSMSQSVLNLVKKGK
jgi:hypothetical protein